VRIEVLVLGENYGCTRTGWNTAVTGWTLLTITDPVRHRLARRGWLWGRPRATGAGGHAQGIAPLWRL